ncbi:MAG TPA: DUF4097 family beta strand repeat-containing protein [Blastocatellia bacterium]|nr:DUF4097 family beta strand repeat-containing protein [Blastocatellia bacterium]
MDCRNCGAEILPGQRFCRKCGTPTGMEDDIATEKMPPPGAPTGNFRPSGTNPTGRPDTSPVYTPPPSPSGYQPSVPPYPPGPYPPYQQMEKRSSPLKWILLLVLACFLGLGILVAVLVSNFSDRRVRPGPPPPATTPGDRPAGELGAPRTFTLGPNARVSINNFNGKVSVEGWDEAQAEVRINRRGGNPQEGAVTFRNENGNLTIDTDVARLRGAQLDFEVKLPRKIAQLAVEGVNLSIELSDLEGSINAKTVNGPISLADVVGNIEANTVNGKINLTDIQGDIEAGAINGTVELIDISGSARTKTVSGTTRVSFNTVADGKPLEFESVSGTIEVEIPDGVNADLEARTTSGSIQLDEEFGIEVVKRTPGESASGQIGSGGQPLNIKTGSGTIRVRKQ